MRFFLEGFSREGLPHFGEEDPSGEQEDAIPSKEPSAGETDPEPGRDASSENAAESADEGETGEKEPTSEDPEGRTEE